MLRTVPLMSTIQGSAVVEMIGTLYCGRIRRKDAPVRSRIHDEDQRCRLRMPGHTEDRAFFTADDQFRRVHRRRRTMGAGGGQNHCRQCAIS